MQHSTSLIFFGSSHHCLVTLDALFRDSLYTIVAVVTQPAKPVGRKQVLTPTAVELWAKEHAIPVLAPNSWKKEVSEKEREQLRSYGAEVGILSNYGKILPQSVIDIFPKGIVNIHPSLLPNYRGPAPAVGVLLNGNRVSGTSIMLLTAAMDAGPVLGAIEFDVESDEIPETYYEKGFRLGTQRLMEVLPDYLSGVLMPTVQHDAEATYTKILTKEDSKIDWSLPIEQIERMIRAYNPWPGAWTEVYVDGRRFWPKDAEMLEKLQIDKKDVHNDNLPVMRLKIISAKLEERLLHLNEVQLEGSVKKEFKTDDLL